MNCVGMPAPIQGVLISTRFPNHYTSHGVGVFLELREYGVFFVYVMAGYQSGGLCNIGMLLGV